MMPCAIAGGAVRVFSVGLKTPFITALGRKTSTTNVELLLRLASGAVGRGEASGSVVMAHQTPEKLAAELKRMLRLYRGRDASAWLPLAREIWSKHAAMPAAAAAFECAVFDALCRRRKIKMKDWFGGACDKLETDLTISAAGPEETEHAASRAARDGFRILKVKVGAGGAKADFERVLAADDAGGNPRLILDGNQKLGVSGTLRLVDACLKRGLKVELVEQPVAREDLHGMRKLTRDCPAPIAADESLRTAEDAKRLIDADAAQVFNVKVAKSGLAQSLEILALARAAGKRLMIGCMQETAAGLSPSVHLALGTGAFSYLDLDSDALLVENQPRGDWKRDGAWISA